MEDKTKSKLKKASAGAVAALGAVALLSVSPINTGAPSDTSDNVQSVAETVENTVENEVLTEEKTDEYASEEGSKGDEKERETDEKQEEADNHLTADEDLSAYDKEIGYGILNNDYSATLTVDIPDSLSIDIAELYFNNCLVDTALFPNKTSFVSIPFVFDDLGRLKIKFYKLGENIGSAVFKEGRLYTDLKGE